MHRNDVYSRNIDYVAERLNPRLAKFVNVPIKEINGTCMLNYEGVPMMDIWCPNNDWNQLMLLVDEVEKIQDVQVVIKGSHCFIARLIQSNENGVDMIEPQILCQFDGGSRIESVFRCCADFVVNVAV